MSVPPGGEVGMEHYPHTDLIFFILKGKAKMIVNSKSRTTRKYEVIFVPAGELHNLTNSGQDDLKLLAIYVPPEYLEDSVCRTQEEAEAARREALEHVWQQ
jgi:mannose-6-phosphate isomerase-like protein (cupin superfamily)